MIHVASLKSKMTIYLACKGQIALFIAKKFIVLTKYSDFADVFSEELAEVLPKYTRINKHAIELEEGKQPPYGPSYSLETIELKTLKTYIKTSLANSFNRPLKSSVDALILFVCKPNSSLCLCVNYQGFNNLTIKNQYPLLLIDKSLDQLE